MDKKYAIFDMDGVLVDSMEVWEKLPVEFLGKKGIHEVGGEILERVRTLMLSESAALFVREFGLEMTPEEAAEEMDAIMAEHYRNDIGLKRGVKDYLEALEAGGVRMCVASATPEHLAESCLKRLGIRGFFQFLLSCETVGAGKRSPEIYLTAAALLGSRPEETAVYEDTPGPLKTAKKAGFHTVAVCDGVSAAFWESMKEAADETLFEYPEDQRDFL